MHTPSALFRPIHIALACLAFLFPAADILHAAARARPDSIYYEMFRGNKKVGWMSCSLSEYPGESGPELKVTSIFKLGFRVLLVKKISMEVREEKVYAKDGLARYYREADIAGHKAFQRGFHDGARFIVDTEIDGKAQHHEFDDSLYDRIPLDSPEKTITPGEQITKRSINFQALRISKSTYSYVLEDLCVGDDTVACKVNRSKRGEHNVTIWGTRTVPELLIKQEDEDPNVLCVRPVAIVWKGADKH